MKRFLRKKKAQDAVAMFFYLAVIIAACVFFLLRTADLQDKAGNPFYGKLGQREHHILNLIQVVEQDLYSLDFLAKETITKSIVETSSTLAYGERSLCGNYLNYPIINVDNNLCRRRINGMKGRLDIYEENIDYDLYNAMLSSNLNYPFNYKYSFVQDNETFKILGYSTDTVRYPIDALDYFDDEFKPSPSVNNRNTIFDVASHCTYVNNARSIAESLYPDKISRVGKYVMAPCPPNIVVRTVPHFPQCSILECKQKSYCSIDQNYLCEVGCGFKSTQMAFAYYGYLYDDTYDYTTTRTTVLPYSSLHAGALNSGKIQREPAFNSRIFENIVKVEDPLNYIYTTTRFETMSVVKEITDKHYQKLLDMLKEGLVIVKLTAHARSQNGGCAYKYPVEDQIGYCPEQHYVLAHSANDEYVIINDPGSFYRINMVYSKEFFKKVWSGRYIQVKAKT